MQTTFYSASIEQLHSEWEFKGKIYIYFAIWTPQWNSISIGTDWQWWQVNSAVNQEMCTSVLSCFVKNLECTMHSTQKNTLKGVFPSVSFTYGLFVEHFGTFTAFCQYFLHNRLRHLHSFYSVNVIFSHVIEKWTEHRWCHLKKRKKNYLPNKMNPKIIYHADGFLDMKLALQTAVLPKQGGKKTLKNLKCKTEVIRKPTNKSPLLCYAYCTCGPHNLLCVSSLCNPTAPAHKYFTFPQAGNLSQFYLESLYLCVCMCVCAPCVA